MASRTRRVGKVKGREVGLEGLEFKNGRFAHFIEIGKRAIEDLGINYPQIVAEQNSVGANVYGVMGIPHIILFGPDGTILERNLRGDGIETAVRKHLGL